MEPGLPAVSSGRSNERCLWPWRPGTSALAAPVLPRIASRLSGPRLGLRVRRTGLSVALPTVSSVGGRPLRRADCPGAPARSRGNVRSCGHDPSAVRVAPFFRCGLSVFAHSRPSARPALAVAPRVPMARARRATPRYLGRRRLEGDRGGLARLGSGDVLESYRPDHVRGLAPADRLRIDLDANNTRTEERARALPLPQTGPCRAHGARAGGPRPTPACATLYSRGAISDSETSEALRP
jgi:hypothetical protein